MKMAEISQNRKKTWWENSFNDLDKKLLKIAFEERESAGFQQYLLFLLYFLAHQQQIPSSEAHYHFTTQS